VSLHRPVRSNAGCCRSSISRTCKDDHPPGYVAFGQVVGVHIDDRSVKDGRLNAAAMQPIARCD
jgi:hypothetical protein